MRRPITCLPDIPGCISSAEVAATAEWIAGLQLPNGMIPWFPGGHCDPWNHVETAMALDIAGLHAAAALAYDWLATMQLPNGSWHNYYIPDGSLEDPKLDTNVTAYIAAGSWHHWLCTGDRQFVERLWPVIERALDWVVSMQRSDGPIVWAKEPNGFPWHYALLTGSSSIWHSLHCGVRLAKVAGRHRPDWTRAASMLGEAIVARPQTFEPKERWAMDWYYPVLAGVVTGEAAKARLGDGWETFVIDGLGVRCVSDEPWITASETAEAALAHAATGDVATATELLCWTRSHRNGDGSYWTGIVYPEHVVFPFDEVSAYTGAAVILAADAINGASPASRLFRADLG
jgi:hypothetical protein